MSAEQADYDNLKNQVAAALARIEREAGGQHTDQLTRNGLQRAAWVIERTTGITAADAAVGT